MAGSLSAAEEKLRAGELSACLTDLQGEVRRNPAESRPRIFLALTFSAADIATKRALMRCSLHRCAVRTPKHHNKPGTMYNALRFEMNS